MASTGVILFAEDNRKLRKLYGDALTAAGYNVIAVPDGREALKLLSIVNPKLIVLDVQMPELNGIETCAQARKICGNEVPIIFLTALDRLDFLHDCIAAGGDDYIIKSDGVQAIVQRVGRWVRRTPGGKPLAARRSEMLSEVAAKVDGEGRSAGPSGEDDENMHGIAGFLCEIGAPAMQQCVKTAKGKHYLLGYVTGVVEYWMETRAAAADRFSDYMKVALQETGCLTEDEVHELMSRFDDLVRDTDFCHARANGRKDPAEWESRDGRYDPVGFDRQRMTAGH